VVGATALSGALYVGDSVRFSLREIAMARIGKIEFAALGQDRFFRAELANDLSQSLGEESRIEPLLISRGSVALGDGSARANQVQILGVDDGFWELARDKDNLPAWDLDGANSDSGSNSRYMDILPCPFEGVFDNVPGNFLKVFARPPEDQGLRNVDIPAPLFFSEYFFKGAADFRDRIENRNKIDREGGSSRHRRAGKVMLHQTGYGFDLVVHRLLAGAVAFRPGLSP